MSCVCVVDPESTRTVRTLLALSYGSATSLGFEWGFESSSSSSSLSAILPPEAGLCGVPYQPNHRDATTRYR